ncbi:MAG: hypothetical protein IJ874_09640 [Ruminococcus sp.]|nr:hypothetical protein [Ruminococcus sp.]
MSGKKLNAKVIFDITDRHLNVFIPYRCDEKYEDNITKALINTFQSLPESDKITFFRELFGIALEESGNSYSCYLQTRPDEDTIKQIPEDDRLLFAFSPTGKSWGTGGIDTGDRTSIKNGIRKALIESDPDISEDDLDKEAEAQTEEVLNIIADRGDPRPDAWIVVYHNEKPQFCVAFENKLYDLNPFQLNNHCKKAMFLSENNIVYHSYSDILETLYGMDGYLVGDFLRYMFIIDHWDVSSVSQLEGMDTDHIKYYSKRCCYELLKKIGRGAPVTWHKSWMYKLDFDKSEIDRCINMIGLDYIKDEDSFCAVLVFAPTQRTAHSFYSIIKEKDYSYDSRLEYRTGFHFNVKGSVANNPELDSKLRVEKDLNESQLSTYIGYWCDNVDQIRIKNKEQRRKLLIDMRDKGVLDEVEFKKLITGSDSYLSGGGNSELEIRPEIKVTVKIPFEEALALDKEGEDKLADTFRERLRSAYNKLNVPEEPWMK